MNQPVWERIAVSLLWTPSGLTLNGGRADAPSPLAVLWIYGSILWFEISKAQKQQVTHLPKVH